MRLSIDGELRTVELLLDSRARMYMDSVMTNQGGLCGLWRDVSSREVIGVRLPLLDTRLVVTGIDGTQVILDESGVHIMGKH